MDDPEIGLVSSDEVGYLCGLWPTNNLAAGNI